MREELNCERNKEGRCDVCRNCFKHIREIGYYSKKIENRNALLEEYFLKIIDGLAGLYLKEGHTCSNKTKRMDINVLIKYLNDKKKELKP